MKSIVIGLLSFFLFAAGIATAQNQKQYDKVKQRIKTELQIDEARADSTATILQHFLTNIRDIRANTNLEDSARQTALKNERKQEVAKLKAFLTAEQIKKLHKLVQEYRDRRQSNKDNADTSLKKYYF